MKNLSKIFAILLFAVTMQVSAKEHKFTEANLMVSFPAKWSTELDNGVLVSSIENEEIAIVFTVIEADNLNKALEAGMTEIHKQYSDLTLDEVKEEKMDNVTLVYTDGRGKRDDGNGNLISVEITVALVPGSNDRFLFIHGVATPDALNKNIDDVGFILKNIRPIKITP
jgi:hypothetical protein